MKFTFEAASEVKVLPCFEEENLAKAVTSSLFKGKVGEVFPKETDSGLHLLLGLGKKTELNNNLVIKAFHALGRKANEFEIPTLSIDVVDLCDFFSAVVEGLIQSRYRNEKYLSKPTKQVLETINFEHAPADAKEKIDLVSTIMDGVFITRNLVNEPAMYLYPETLAQQAKEKLTSVGVDVEILDKAAIEALDMKAFLAVARGSSKEPRFIIMRYMGNKDNSTVTGLVGKGLTYDSGGYCIKPPSGMSTMHTDMGGAGTVIGALYSIAKAKLPVNVIGVVASCENMISGDAYKTGDIVGSMSGKTIEIENTDAEGRVTLADSLYYTATELKVDRIIDLATLTGACLIALGDVATGAVTNDQEFLDELIDAAKATDEPMWQLPTYSHYKEQIKSPVADLKNTGGRLAGTITAGLFLEEFVEGLPWIHLDIAGTSYLEKARDYWPKGATGFGVKTLFEFFARG